MAGYRSCSQQQARTGTGAVLGQPTKVAIERCEPRHTRGRASCSRRLTRFLSWLVRPSWLASRWRTSMAIMMLCSLPGYAWPVLVAVPLWLACSTGRH